MFPFLDISTLNSDVLIAATRTMLRIARVDGLHPAEEELISAFYSSCADGQGWPTFTALLQEGDYHVDAALFGGEAERDMLLALAVMTAYADGSFSEAEQAAVRSISGDVNMTSAQLDAIINQVKDHMLAQLSHLPDAASVAKVASELG